MSQPATATSTSPSPAALAAPAPAAAAPAGAPSPSAAAPAAKPPATGAAAVDIDPAQLKAFTVLSRSEREAKAKVKELEAKLAGQPAPDPEAAKRLERAAAIEKHVADGDLLAAAGAAGIDVEAAFEKWLAAEKAGDAPAADKAVAELKGELDGVKKRLEDDAKTKEDAKAKDIEAAKQRAHQEAAGFMASMVSDNEKEAKEKGEAPRWARCGDPEAVTKALTISKEKGAVIMKEIGRALTDDEAVVVFGRALDDVEAERAELGRKFYRPEAPKQQTPRHTTRRETREVDTGERRAPALTIDGRRGTLVTPQPDRQQFMTAKEAKKMVLDKLRSRSRANA